MRWFAGFVLLMGLISGACGGDDHDVHDLHEGLTRGSDSHGGTDSDSELEKVPLLPALVLEDGEPWPMDEHTRLMFSSMVARWSSHEGDPRELGALLQGDTQTLIAGCTMQGAAHDQLHAYLTTYLPALQKLADTGSVEAGEIVKEHLDLYPRYFE